MAKLPTLEEIVGAYQPYAAPAPMPGGAMAPPAPVTATAPAPFMGLPPGVDLAQRPIGTPYQGTVNQSASTAFNPIAEALGAWGANQEPGIWQNLALWAAPGVNA